MSAPPRRLRIAFLDALRWCLLFLFQNLANMCHRITRDDSELLPIDDPPFSAIIFFVSLCLLRVEAHYLPSCLLESSLDSSTLEC